jgi:hypothetical protein
MPWPSDDWADLEVDFELAYANVPDEKRDRDWAIYNLIEERTSSVDRADFVYGAMLGRMKDMRSNNYDDALEWALRRYCVN